MARSLRLRLPHMVALGATVLATGVVTDDADACGGCFHLEQGSQGETSVVIAHRMAVSISTDQTVLWDQVQYAGDPTDFAWVLPIKPGARLELGTDAFFETLEAATQAMVVSPALHCVPAGGGSFDDDGGYYDYNGEDEWYGDGYSGGCCGGTSDAYGGGDGAEMGAGNTGNTANTGAGNAGNIPPPPPPVEVVHEATVGPYETVTLSANEEGVLQDWLAEHGYAVDESIEPVIEAYVAEGFDFIAMRLAPGAGVGQMRPVRVVSPGAEPTLPLRMVAAGTGAEVGLTLFVISEGRWESNNFPNGTIAAGQLTWDVASSSSNYSVLRAEELAKDEGRRWLTSYARPGALLSGVINPAGSGGNVVYSTESGLFESIAAAYFFAGLETEEIGAEPVDVQSCATLAEGHALTLDRVVWECDGQGGGGSGGEGGTGGVGGDGGVGGGTGGTGGVPVRGDIPCEEVGAGTLAAQDFNCGDLQDLGIAFVGLHPADVWLTRLEANLPRVALESDFAMRASMTQVEIAGRYVAADVVNSPCEEGSLAPIAPVVKPPRPYDGGGRGKRARWAMMSIVALGLLAFARVVTRPAPNLRRRGAIG